MTNTRLCLLTAVATAALATATGAFAQTAESRDAPAAESRDSAADQGEIIVTANKRQQSITDVGLTIAAATSDQLQERGVVDIGDLGKIVSGFTAQPSPYDTPVYTLRGVGLYEAGFASSPAVTVYVDQVALPFPLMQRGATLDLERVEVLKGPQGTIFGQNSTGGAINYIAAKPSADFAAGGRISYERFGKLDASGYVSGPLLPTLNARLAVRAVSGGAWQKSASRPNDELGDAKELYGRILLDWNPAPGARFSLNLNGWSDKGSPQVGQLRIISPTATAPAPRQAAVVAALSPSLVTGESSRLADWTPGFPFKNDRFWQAALRSDIDLTSDIVWTTIGSYQELTIDRATETDGAAASNLQPEQSGFVRGYAVESRLVGRSGGLDWVVGGAYDDSRVLDDGTFHINDSTLTAPVGIVFNSIRTTVRQRIKNWAVFGNAEYELFDGFKVSGGIRYTESARSARSCSLDGDQVNLPAARTFEILQGAFVAAGAKTTPIVPIGRGQCLQFSAAPDLSPQLNGSTPALDENNLSWRGGVNYKTGGGSLFYATVGRGYKSGVNSNTPSSAARQYDPVVQESVMSYEAGVKTSLFDRMVQANAAAFYYDYTNKQLRARIPDRVFGLLEALINVPKSEVWGFEADATIRPDSNLTINLSGAYVRSKVKGSFIAVPVGQNGLVDVGGSVLPYTPRWTGTADVQYDWPLTNGLNAFVGSTFLYRSKSQASFTPRGGTAGVSALPAQTLLDLRAGVSGKDDAWRIEAFGRNLLNDKYWVSVFRSPDAVIRFTGRPLTYGVAFTFKY